MGSAKQDAEDGAEYEALLDDIWVAERKIIDLCSRSPVIASVEALRDHTAQLRQFKRDLEKQRG